MLKLILFSFLVLLSACNGNEKVIYHKYVYIKPKLGFPFEAVSEVDIWFARIRFRGLTKNVEGNLIELDLAESIDTKDFKSFTIKLKKGQTFSDGSEIDSDAVIKSIENLIKNIKVQLTENIDTLDKLSKHTFVVKVKNKDPHFRKALASHLFLIHNYKNPEIVSGLYKFNNDKFLLVANDKSYPNVIKPVITNEVKEKIEYNYFDTALMPPGSVLNNAKTKNYKLFETWGLVLDLKKHFKNQIDRRCLNDSINRIKLVKNVLNNHQAVSNFKGESKESTCDIRLKFTLDIPQELEAIGEKFCLEIKLVHDVTCKFMDFNKLLTNIKTNNFNASLLSLTLDLTYVESISQYLVKNDSFSIINIDTELPEELTEARGDEYIEELSKYIERTNYFIPISRPIRKLSASNLDKYKPSLIGPSYDYLENLKR